jgi:hypothetical protein
MIGVEPRGLVLPVGYCPVLATSLHVVFDRSIKNIVTARPVTFPVGAAKLSAIGHANPGEALECAREF